MGRRPRASIAAGIVASACAARCRRPFWTGPTPARLACRTALLTLPTCAACLPQAVHKGPPASTACAFCCRETATFAPRPSYTSAASMSASTAGTPTPTRALRAPTSTLTSAGTLWSPRWTGLRSSLSAPSSPLMEWTERQRRWTQSEHPGWLQPGAGAGLECSRRTAGGRPWLAACAAKQIGVAHQRWPSPLGSSAFMSRSPWRGAAESSPSCQAFQALAAVLPAGTART